MNKIENKMKKFLQIMRIVYSKDRYSKDSI